MSDTTISNAPKRRSIFARFRDIQTLAGIGALVLIWALLQ